MAKVVKVIYQKVFPLAQYVNEKIGVEIEMDGTTETFDDVMFDAKEMVEKFHKDSNPLLYMNLGETVDTLVITPKVIQVKNPYFDRDGLATDIKSCNTIKDIDEYRVMVNSMGYEWVLPIWETRRDELVKIESDALIAAANGYKGSK